MGNQKTRKLSFVDTPPRKIDSLSSFDNTIRKKSSSVANWLGSDVSKKPSVDETFGFHHQSGEGEYGVEPEFILQSKNTFQTKRSRDFGEKYNL
jgi:hypothetical protein